MTLEDHAGDAIRKARQGKDVAAATVATTGNLTDEQLAELEDKGSSSGTPNYRGMAALLSLHPDKLERVASGWVPEATDLSRWSELRKIETDDGGMAVNCYLIWDADTREAALFDTGWISKPILDLIEEHDLNLSHLFITHTHHDHIAAMGDIRKAFPEVRLHSSNKNTPLEQRNRATDFVHVGGLRITNRETPGHAEDGVTYIIGDFPNEAPKTAMVGDAIFAGSIGGAPKHFGLAREMVQEKILSLPDDTLICPGHGPVTTVGEEKANNPFFM